jgi:hypothetical protein
MGLYLLTMLAGCALQGFHGTSIEAHNSQITDFLQYFHHAKSLDRKELHQLYIQEEGILFNQNDHDSTLRLALLSLLQDSKLQTTSRAIDLLQSSLYENHPDKERRHLAVFLLHTLSQSQYRALNHQITTEKLNMALKERDELAARYQQVKVQLEHAWIERHKQHIHNEQANQALLQEQRAVENLRKQIEQLKVIEKTLDQRKKEKPPAT